MRQSQKTAAFRGKGALGASMTSKSQVLGVSVLSHMTVYGTASAPAWVRNAMAGMSASDDGVQVTLGSLENASTAVIAAAANSGPSGGAGHSSTG